MKTLANFTQAVRAYNEKEVMIDYNVTVFSNTSLTTLSDEEEAHISDRLTDDETWGNLLLEEDNTLIKFWVKTDLIDEDNLHGFILKQLTKKSEL